MNNVFDESLKEAREIHFKCLFLNQPYIKVKNKTFEPSSGKSSLW